MSKTNESVTIAPLVPITPTTTSELDSYKVSEGMADLHSFMDRRLRGVPTGWTAVDKAILGLGGLVVLQGAPGSNKSTAALQIASYNARRGCPSLIIDEENGRERTRIRLLCQLTGLSELGLQEMRLARPPQFAKALSMLDTLPIYIASGVVDGPEQIDRLADCLVSGASTSGAAFCTLVVDSVQSLPRIGDDERSNLELWLKYFDRLKLKHAGKLVILVTSEKNYATFDEASLKGGKGSSAISYKGETILDFTTRAQGTVRITVIKNRDGFRGVSWEMELQLADPKNPASFNFTLAPVGELPG